MRRFVLALLLLVECCSIRDYSKIAGALANLQDERFTDAHLQSTTLDKTWLRTNRTQGKGNPAQILFSGALTAFVLAIPAQMQSFCWQPLKDRGVGRPRSKCEGGRELDALGALCYEPCPEHLRNLGRAGPVCMGNNLAIEGRTGTMPTCQPNEESDGALLCYNKCPADYKGVVTNCVWKCPAELPWQCLGGCASSQLQCAAQTLNQLYSITGFASVTTLITSLTTTVIRKCGGRLDHIYKKIESLGDSAKENMGLKTEADSLNEEIQQALAEALFENAKEWFKKPDVTVQQVYDELRKSSPEANEASHQHLWRLLLEARQAAKNEQAAQNFQLRDLDVLGIVDIVRAFWRPTCDQLKRA